MIKCGNVIREPTINSGFLPRFNLVDTATAVYRAAQAIAPYAYSAFNAGARVVASTFATAPPPVRRSVALPLAPKAEEAVGERSVKRLFFPHLIYVKLLVFPLSSPVIAKNERDPVKETFWREVLERHGASGQSVREFLPSRATCRESVLLVAADDRRAGWFSRRRRPAILPSFAQVVVKAATPCNSSVVVELAGGCLLRFSGLAEAVRGFLGHDSPSGSLVVFRSKSGHLAQVLWFADRTHGMGHIWYASGNASRFGIAFFLGFC